MRRAIGVWILVVPLVVGCGRESDDAARRSAGGVGGVGGAVGVSFTPGEREIIATMSPLPAVPPDPTNAWADDAAAARLGQFIFFDERFSVDGAMSCATCHDPALGFADGRQAPDGRGPVDRHTMSLLDVAHHRWFFWDGRSDSLWAQGLVPLEHPNEQAMTRLACVHLVYRDNALRAAYEAIFGPMPPLDDAARFPATGRPVPDDPAHPHHVAYMGMTPEDRDAVDRAMSNLLKAIAAYERRLVRGPAPFDRFVEGLRAGDPVATASMSPAAQRGLRLFVGRAGCRTCHLGATFSDGEFHNTGVPPRDRAASGGAPRDPGRYRGAAVARSDPFNASGSFSDDRTGPAAARVERLVAGSETWGQFKTPTLRNAALTAPYMHEGQFATLEEVVRYYATLEGAILPTHHQETVLAPLDLSEREIADLVAFIEALVGEPLDASLLKPPPSPAS